MSRGSSMTPSMARTSANSDSSDALDNVPEDRSLAEGDLDTNAGQHQLGEVVRDGVRVSVARQLRARLRDDGREGHRSLLAMMRTIASATTDFGCARDGPERAVAADHGHLVVVRTHADAFA